MRGFALFTGSARCHGRPAEHGWKWQVWPDSGWPVSRVRVRVVQDGGEHSTWNSGLGLVRRTRESVSQVRWAGRRRLKVVRLYGVKFKLVRLER